MSDFRKRKARTYLNLLDYDKDGYISEEDFGGLARRFAEAYEASEERKEGLIKSFVTVWKLYMKSADIDKDRRLSVEVLAESTKQLHYDPGFIIAINNLIRGMYELMDINEDGYLQPEEHQTLFKNVGVPDGSFDHKLAFEAIDANGDGKISIEEFIQEGKYVEGKNLHYTDDTAMLKSVTESLFHCNGFDATDLSKRFAKEYFARPDRGYGSNIPAVFREMKETKYKDPFGPASRQFNGSGSYGNGGAMRIAPAALFGLKFNDTEFNVLVENITRVTHSHSQGINGAILEASAVKIALQSADSVGSFSCSKMLTDLQKIMSTLETSNSEIRAADEKNLFCEKLKKIKEFVERSEPTVDEVVNVLGNDVSAIKSVPAAIYSFLRTVEKPAEGWEKPYNQFERTIIYSISLGGDTDTIASMAGAIAGAYCGIDNIPESWQMSCEGLDDAKLQAKNLYSVALKDS